MKNRKILLVEDEGIIAADTQFRLETLGYTVTGIASAGRTALSKIEEERPDLVLMDIRLKGDLDGIETADIIKNRHHIPVIYVTAYSDDDIVRRVKITEPFGYLVKPFEDRELHSNIEIALYKHEVERELRQSRTFLQNIIDAITHPIVVINKDKRVRIFNKAAAGNVNGSSFSENRDMLCHQLCYGCITPCARCLLDETVKSARPVTALFTHTQPDNSVRHSEVVASPLFAHDGSVDCIIESIHDITGLKNAEEEINRQKEKFVSVLMHDIKSPLFPIIGFTQRLLEDKHITGKDIKKELTIIKNSAESILEHIENVSRHMRDNFTLSEVYPMRFDISGLVNSVINNFIPQIERRELKLSKHIGSEENNSSMIINADPEQIKSMMENLLANAIKYAKRSITVTVNRSGSAISLKISDDGPGISECYHGKIFEEYFQVPGSKKGTGLGLYSVKKVVENHGGKISIESDDDAGATFEVFLPG